jgi:F-type H+-transporting ATPase subunit c
MSPLAHHDGAFTQAERIPERRSTGPKTANFDKGSFMKKFFALFLALGAFALAGEGESMIQAYSVVAAGVGLGLAALGGAIGMGHTAAATIAGTARNPGLGGKLMTTMFIALAMIEAQVIYTLVIALIALYANPFLG